MLFRAKVERPHSQHGQILVLFALASFVLIGFMALAFDVGFLLTERRNAQNMADAAALAGAHALWQKEGTDAAESTADAYATLNGADASTTVIPVAEGDHLDGTVTVTVQQPVEKFFLGALYTGSWEVSTRAVAAVRDIPNSGAALLALDDEPGMDVRGEIRVTIHDGSAMSNGDILRSGAPNIFYTDGSISAVGTVEEGPYWEAGNGIDNGASHVDDPLAELPPPPIPTDVVTEEDIAGCYANPPQDCVLVPGYYHNLPPITIKATATMQPGLYYFEGTSITLGNTNAKITDNDGGVMLYFAEGSSPSTTYFDPGTSGPSGGVHLTAPATSPYDDGLDGMTLWIDNCSEFDSQGNGEFYLRGVFYAPCSLVSLHGNPYGETIDGQIIAGNLTLRGTADFVVQYHDYVDLSRRGVFLVE